MRQLPRQASHGNTRGVVAHARPIVSRAVDGRAVDGDFNSGHLATGGYQQAQGHMPPQRALVPVQAPSAALQAGGAAAFALLFRDLRRALGLSLPAAAARVGTRVDVISALESGDVRRLPPWSETVRIVSRYTGLAGVDPRPVLELIERELAECNRASAAVEDAPTGLSGLGARLGELCGRARSWLEGGGAKLPVGWQRLSTIGVLSAVLVVLFAQASSLQASLATLQPPIMGLMRSAQDYLLARVAPERDGLRWIEVHDPRQRRGDRLTASGKLASP